MIKKVFILLVLPAILCGCEKINAWRSKPIGENVVAQVNGHCLYDDELNAMIPDGASPEDSTRIAQRYIMQWAKRQIVYGTARRNISDTATISRLVEQYRRQLYVYNYEQELVNERMDKNVSDEELQAFYNEHSSELKLKEPVMSGRVILVPLSLADDKKIVTLMAATKEDDVNELHSFALSNAYKYVITDEDFVPVSSLASLLDGAPDINWSNPPKGVVTWQTDNAAGFMLINNSRGKGEQTPFQYAITEIKQTILNQRKSSFIDDFEQQMLEQAIADGELVRRNKNIEN